MQRSQTHPGGRDIQGTNQGPNALENVDALKSQTVEPHTHVGRPDSAYSRYQL